MERYETALLELVNFEEDVIAASESSNSTDDPTAACWYCFPGEAATVWFEADDGDNYAVNYYPGSAEYSQYCG